MNKKLVISISIIGLIAAIGAVGTIAYFSDSEKSTGNIIVAGNVDLKVDHSAQMYNGVDCKTCKVEIMSDTTNMVVSTIGGDDPVAFPHAAVKVSNPHSAWTVTNDIPGATWIWATNPTTAHDAGNNDVYYTFEKTFPWYGPINGATLKLGVGADNGFEVKLNGNIVGSDMTEWNYQSPAEVYTNFAPFIVQGTNVLTIKVKNKALAGGTPSSNPAGLLYKLTIDGNCNDDYFKNNCQLFGAKDLENETFFKFNDVKPGDFGSNVISLHVYNNESFGCLTFDQKTDKENGCTEAEKAYEALCEQTEDGELDTNIKMFIWNDKDHDAKYDAGEYKFTSSPVAFADLKTISLFDSSTAMVLAANSTDYVSMFWCAGNLTLNQDGSFACTENGENDNQYQSDSLTADLIFNAVQKRHNETYSCQPKVK